MLKLNYNCVDYDYNTSRDCETSGYCDSICRCSKIVDIKIESVNLSSLTEEIYSQLEPSSKKSKKRNLKLANLLYGGDTVDKYCINRILTAHKAWDENYWNVGVENGYYGEEIGEVTIDTGLIAKISNDVDAMYKLETLTDKIKYVVNLEYGYLNNTIANAEFELIAIFKNDIEFKKLNQNHINDIKSKDTSYYNDENYYYPKGIVKKSGNMYKIIDGFHRILTSESKKIEVFCIK